MKDALLVLLLLLLAVFGSGTLLWMLDCLEEVGKLVC